MPPCISKDREDLVAAAENRLTQVCFTVTEHCIRYQRPQARCSRISAPRYLLAPSCLAAVVCRETSGETHLISIEVQQDLPCGYRIGVTLGQGRIWYISPVRVHPYLGACRSSLVSVVFPGLCWKS